MRRASIGSSTFAPIGMTWFAGAGHFEFDEEIDANGNWVVKEFRHTISSPEGAIGVVAVAVNSGGSSITDRYFLKDHLGSNAGTFTANGLESRATYDVWGNRISSGTPALSGFDTSQRGYTGHEHLATYGLIHMNGRIYDPLLGRFLQADPIIQSPYDLQSYNRYAYVMNNPLAYTDPTGYSRWTNFRDRYGKTILAIGVSVVLGPGGYYGAWVGGSKVATAAAAGFAAGGILGGNLNSALAGAVSGALFGAAGAMTTPTSFASYPAHAAAGCASAAASGGSCGSGAAGAVVGKLFTNLTVASLGQSSPGAHFAGAVIGGGMGALAAGGRFQDGAFSAGLGYALNYCSAGKCDFGWEQALYDWLPGYKAGTLAYNQTVGDGSWTGWEVLDAASIGVGAAAKGLQTLKGFSVAGREIQLVDGFYQADGSAFKFSKYYYEKLWATGRGAPFLQAQEVLQTATAIAPDRMAGFYRYTNTAMEMVYNPKTREVWHLMPLKK